MEKYKKIILIVLGVLILILLGLNIWKSNKKIEDEVVLQELKNKYEDKMKKVDSNMVPLNKYLKKDEKNKIVYEFKNSYLVIGYQDKSKVTKLYVHILKEKYEAKEWQEKLKVLVSLMNPNLNEKEVTKTVKKLQDIQSKKSDEVGMLVQFEESGCEYITMEKEEGKYLEFFIYKNR